MPTLRLDDKRWRELEKKAVEITIKKTKPVTVPEVLKALIDKELKNLEEKDVEVWKVRNPHKSTLLKIVYSRFTSPLTARARGAAQTASSELWGIARRWKGKGELWRQRERTDNWQCPVPKRRLSRTKGCFAVSLRGATGTSSLLFGQLKKALPRSMKSALIPAGLVQRLILYCSAKRQYLVNFFSIK